MARFLHHNLELVVDVELDGKVPIHTRASGDLEERLRRRPGSCKAYSLIRRTRHPVFLWSKKTVIKMGNGNHKIKMRNGKSQNQSNI